MVIILNREGLHEQITLSEDLEVQERALHYPGRGGGWGWRRTNAKTLSEEQGEQGEQSKEGRGAGMEYLRQWASTGGDFAS